MDLTMRSKGPWTKIILDEIGLEGLEGITVEGLWIRFEEALCIKTKIPEYFKNLIWEFVKKQDKRILQFYELPQPKEKIKLGSRSDFIDPQIGFPVLPDECPFTRYTYKNISEGSIRGSCEHFYERKEISSGQLVGVSLDQLKDKYGEKFVIVASQDYRESLLFPENSQKANDLTAVQYCVLEAIGRSRYNGEVTGGKHSLNTYIKDFMDIFYIKVKLHSLQLIVKQTYIERLQGRISSGYLLTLPRFFRVYKTRPIILIETLFNILKSIPTNLIDVEYLKKSPPFDTISFKKLSKIPIFAKNFELTRVPNVEFYTEAELKKQKGKGCRLENTTFAIKFKNPDVTLEEIIDSTNPEITEAENIEFLSEKHYFLDMSFQEQVYRFIAKHGSVGCSQMQITRYTAISKYSVRQLIRNFLKKGFIKEYATDVGRQRVIMYVTYDNEKHIASKKTSSAKEILKDSKLGDENIVKLMNEKVENIEELDGKKPDKLKLDKLNQVMAIIKESQTPYNFTENKGICDPKTARHNERIKTIVNIINSKFFIEKTNLRKHIISEEGSLGYKDQICSKSLYRLIRWLIYNKMARFYELTLKYKKYVKIMYYITHVKLESDFTVLQNEIEKQKNHLLVTIEDREIKHQSKQKQKQMQMPVPCKTVLETLAKAPKFLTAKLIHEFIYFLVYEQDRNVSLIQNYYQIESSLRESATNYDFSQLEEDLSVGCYDSTLSWKTFIQPLPIYQGKPSGWAYVMDIYLRLPLSLIIKLYQINKYSHPLFSEYVNHPIKQHYLVHKLPNELQDILASFRVARTLISTLKFINCIGLTQVGERTLKDLRECWVYINRKAKILDTTISSPKYRQISTDKTYNEINCIFNTFSDVQNYWNTLYRVCLTTKLGAKNELKNCSLKFKRYEVEFSPPVDFDEALKNDIGFIPGDNLGASGLESSLFSHLQRNWSWTVIKKKSIGKMTNKLNKIRFSSQAAKMAIEKPIKLKPNQKSVKLKSKRIVVKRIKQVKQVPRKKGDYDKIDKEALNKMSSLRVSWSKEEDRMLKICRAVYIYLSESISQLQRAINSYIFRDILHWSLNSVNKTSKACQRRLRYILRHSLSPDVTSWIHELKENPQIIERFGIKVLMNLRNLYKNDAEFINILKILYVKLVYYLNKIIQNENERLQENRTLIPDTMNEFYLLYKETQTLNPSNDIVTIREFSLKHRDPHNIEDVEISTINSLMHSTLCCTRDKTLYNIQLYEVYKKFKEEVLAKAYKKARDDNLVVQLKFKSGASGSKLAPISGSSIILSVKYKQQLYLDIPYEAVSLCFQYFESSLQNFFSLTPTPLCVKTFDVGAFYYILELLAKDRVNIDIQMPQKILIVDPNHSSSFEEETERIMDHFHTILDSAPKNEYLKHFEEDNQNNTNSRIKFNKTNESYKLTYNPYDFLSKLPDDYYHFYCALDNFNKIIDLDFSRFNVDIFCPFNCILKSSDLINTIERIINERKIIIEDLIKNPENEEIIESIVVLNQKNIIQIFERLQKILRERNLSNDQKDFGKLKTDRSQINILKLSKDLLDYAEVDIDNKLEFESNTIKEDKNKSQDVFVVNLPTLKLTYKEDDKKEDKKNDYVIYKNLPLPKEIVKNSIYREEILKKVISLAHWSHNGSTKQFFQSITYKKMTNFEQNFTENLLNYLESYELGATAEMLVEHFKDEKLLVKICSILRKNFLIMRVGIENFIYVHKNNVTPWIVNSYNIKRLDKESLQGSKVLIKSTTETGKRPAEKNNCDEPPIKKEAIDKGDGKRIAKPNPQYQASEQNVKTKELIVPQKENVIIRPFPWIRVNGSLNRRVLDKWIGVILTDCLLNSGQSLISICQRFNQLHPMNLRCLLEILQDVNCIQMKVLLKPKKATLFSNYEDEFVEERDATEFSKMDETFIITLPNALLNLSIFIGEKKYGIDFV